MATLKDPCDEGVIRSGKASAPTSGPWILAATIFGSAMAYIDGTVVNVALPEIQAGCTHTDQIRAVEPSTRGCEECLQMADTWAHLRECLDRGHVGCCDQSVALQRRNALSFRATYSPAGSLDLTVVA